MSAVNRQKVTTLIFKEYIYIVVNFLRIIHRVMKFYSAGRTCGRLPRQATRKRTAKASGILREQDCDEMRAILTYEIVNLIIRKAIDKYRD